MTLTTWFTMIGIMALVWGGFALALRTALRRESRRPDDSATPSRTGEDQSAAKQ